MSTHNQWSPEVSRLRMAMSDYGGPQKYRNACPMPDSYKAQALHELAARLLLEDKNDELKARISTLVDRVETLECEADIARMPAK